MESNCTLCFALKNESSQFSLSSFVDLAYKIYDDAIHRLTTEYQPFNASHVLWNP